MSYQFSISILLLSILYSISTIASERHLGVESIEETESHNETSDKALNSEVYKQRIGDIFEIADKLGMPANSEFVDRALKFMNEKIESKDQKVYCHNLSM